MDDLVMVAGGKAEGRKKHEHIADQLLPRQPWANIVYKGDAKDAMYCYSFMFDFPPFVIGDYINLIMPFGQDL